VVESLCGGKKIADKHLRDKRLRGKRGVREGETKKM